MICFFRLVFFLPAPSVRGFVTQSDYQPASAPRPRSHGCLFSCLGIVGLIVLAGAGAMLYSGWFVYEGFRNDATLQMAMSQVKANRVARDVLGDNIVIESMESETISAATGHGKSVAYAVRLRGSKGEGLLHVLFHSGGHDMKIVSMVLTGPDEERYNLSGSGPPPPSDSI
jgi:hypothetical protein